MICHSFLLSFFLPSFLSFFLSFPHFFLSFFFFFFFLVRREFADRARSLEHLSGIVTDLFVDWHRLHGRDSRNKIPDLQRVIISCADDFDRLLDAFFNLPVGPQSNTTHINGSSPKNSKGY